MSRAPRRTVAERRAERAAVQDAEIVLAAAARLLEVRQRSQDEVRRRLVTAGYPPELVDEVIERLVGLGYLDDAEFARAWIESRDRARPRGERALRLELRRKGVAPELVDAALRKRGAAAHRGGAVGAEVHHPEPSPDPATDEDAAAPDAGAADVAAARRLLERRAAALARVPDPRKRRQRAYGLLARNGFDAETIRTALDLADQERELAAEEGVEGAELDPDDRGEIVDSAADRSV